MSQSRLTSAECVEAQERLQAIAREIEAIYDDCARLTAKLQRLRNEQRKLNAAVYRI